MIESENILSVSELNNLIKKDLEYNFPDIIVEGEISNFTSHSSGHKYFSLKDSNSQISAVMWKGQRLDFQPENGQNVIAFGNLSVYPPRGSYQIQVSKLVSKGIGNLFIELEKLKEKLKAKNYFSLERKRKITSFPSKIGISTSPTGAAIRDIISTIRRRYPATELYIRPTIVQGDKSSVDIVDAINELNNQNCDVIIVGRGGGSFEDLWSYNSEIVADAIYNSETPIISAVGHESDFTIADLVADIRAATPTAAAEIATPILFSDIENYVLEAESNFSNILREEIEERKEKIKIFSTNKSLLLLKNKLNMLYQQLDYNESSINDSIKNKFKDIQNRILNFEVKINTFNPDIPLKRGYTLIEKGKNKINSKDKLNPNDKIRIIRYNQSNDAIILDENQKQIF